MVLHRRSEHDSDPLRDPGPGPGGVEAVRPRDRLAVLPGATLSPCTGPAYVVDAGGSRATPSRSASCGLTPRGSAVIEQWFQLFPSDRVRCDEPFLEPGVGTSAACRWMGMGHLWDGIVPLRATRP